METNTTTPPGGAIVPDLIVTVELDRKLLNSGQPEKYNTYLEGEPLLTRSRVPMYDTCRALLERGITGRVAFVDHATGKLRMSMDIEAGALLTVRENSDRGPKLVKYAPYPDRVQSPARVSDLLATHVPETELRASVVKVGGA